MATWLTQTCAHCGQTYTPTRSDSIYCTAACRVAAHRAKASTPALVAVCVVCGQEFQPKRAGALYCSPSCKGKAYRRRYNEWKKRVMMRSGQRSA